MLEFDNKKTPKARKEYKCALCGGHIATGEQYVRYSGKYDGTMFDEKYHTSCSKLIDAYCQANDTYEYDDWAIQDWIAERLCCDLCTEEEYDSCTHGYFQCPKVLCKLGIEREEDHAEQCASH